MQISAIVCVCVSVFIGRRESERWYSHFPYFPYTCFERRETYFPDVWNFLYSYCFGWVVLLLFQYIQLLSVYLSNRFQMQVLARAIHLPSVFGWMWMCAVIVYRIALHIVCILQQFAFTKLSWCSSLFVDWDSFNIFLFIRVRDLVFIQNLSFALSFFQIFLSLVLHMKGAKFKQSWKKKHTSTKIERAKGANMVR